MKELKEADQHDRSKMQKKATHVSYPLQSLLNPLTRQNDEDSDEPSSEASQSNDNDRPNELSGLNELHGLNEPNGLNEPFGEDEVASSSSSSSSSEEIATPLAIRSEKVMNQQDVEASENRTMLRRGFNSNCVRYSFPKHCFVC